MALDNDDTISIVNQLIETCKESEEGFREAADRVKDPSIRSLFNRYSRQRAQFISELQAEVRRLGSHAEPEGSVAGAMQRHWHKLRSVMPSQDRHDILAEAEHGEDEAMRTYQDALSRNLPPDVRTVVQVQCKKVRDAHDRFRALELATA